MTRRREWGREESDKGETSRTSVVLRRSDRENLDRIRTIRPGASDMEAIRMSLRLAARIVQWHDEGGDVLLRRGKDVVQIEFV